MARPDAVVIAMNKAKKIHVGILYGGRSCEHEVSVTSARCVYEELDQDRYEVTLIGITKSGQWILADKTAPVLENKIVEVHGQVEVNLDYQNAGKLNLPVQAEQLCVESQSLDVIFPILHGPFGEDGTIQGLLEMAGLAYVGSGVTGSAASMDKVVAKSVFKAEGIPQSCYRSFRKSQWEVESDDVIDRIENELQYPLFVKPANLGSSVGISKVRTRDELIEGINLAFNFDVKIAVENALENCYEVEVSVLGNDRPEASVVGEIIPGGEFYDYNDKYIDNLSKTVIPADLPDEVTEKIQEYAKRAFLALDAAGLARVDFFVHRVDHSIYINEINTMPGFTPISMYPKLWEASGIGYSELLDQLILLALERRDRHSKKQLVL